MFYKKDKKLNTGFTIIETMISISIFLVVVMIGMDSLLNAGTINQKSKDDRSLMDSLTFIMEDMSRNIRTGYSFQCIQNSGGDVDPGDITNISNSCPDGEGAIAFENSEGIVSDNSDQWVYEFTWGVSDFNISKSTNGATSFVRLNPDEIKFSSQSGFYVSGATSGESQQPLVNIRLIGKIITKGKVTSFSIQNTVSQRALK